MTPDDYLERLLDAVDKNNYKDSQLYAQAVLDQIHLVHPTYRKDLTEYLQQIISSASHQLEQQKANLIEEIMNSR